MVLPAVLAVLLVVCSVAAASAPPTRTQIRRDSSAPDGFITAQGTQFILNGKPFNFVGTDAYWLPMLNDTNNVRSVLQSMKDTNLSVVRVWAFNDVVEIPPNNATYFQLFQNGTATVNTGPNGLQRLDAVVDIAGQLGLKVMLTTTNNWNPQNTNGTAGLPGGSPLSTLFPHGYLSNDYGGMDLYVRQIKGEAALHDDFYDDETIKNAFKAYLGVLIPRYKDNPTVFGWELANDPRCNSTLPNSDTCNTNTVTQWHSEIAQRVQQLDPNHLIASGAQGFQCMQDLSKNCKKLFPIKTPPPPKTSGTPHTRKRSSIPLTLKALRELRIATKKRRPVEPRLNSRDGRQIRGRWAPAPTKRQATSDSQSAFDGSFGVDSQDILNIPDIGFSSFQLFPDQNSYFAADPNLNSTQNSLEEGTNWIQAQALAALQVGKPSVMTSFGLVTANNSAFFVPFNSTASVQSINPTFSSPLTDAQQASTYSSWIGTAVDAGINGVIQYQWSQPGLTTSGGGGVVTVPNGGTTTTPDSNGGVVTPDDGYGSQQGDGPGTLINQILGQGAALQNARNV